MQFFRDFVSDLELPGRFGNLLKKDDEPDHIEQETSLYKRDILRLMLLFKEDNSEEELIEVLSLAGHAVYLGGNQTSKLGLSLLPRLAGIFRDNSSSNCLKIQALKTMSEMCSQYKDYQNKVAELGCLTLLLELATESDHDETSNWAYYCLTVLVSDNIPLMRELQRIYDITSRIHNSMHHNKKGQKYYAKILLKLLGLGMETSH